MASTSLQQLAEKSWHSAFPEPASQPITLSRDDLKHMIERGKIPGKDFLLIDLRRTDYEGGTIAGSINLPAQSLYPTIPTLYNLLKAAEIHLVIWYCGSSKGRGNRAASWFADHVVEQSKHGQHGTIESKALLGGIKGWASAGNEYRDLMQGYDAAFWKSSQNE